MRDEGDRLTRDAFKRAGAVVVSPQELTKPSRATFLVRYEMDGRISCALKLAEGYTGTEVEAVNFIRNTVNAWADGALGKLLQERYQ